MMLNKVLLTIAYGAYVAGALGFLLRSTPASADINTTVLQIAGQAMNPLAPVKAPVGMVVGVITRGGFVKTYAWGKSSLGGALAPDGDSLFEIASISKTFTATLLAQATLDGKITLESPVASTPCEAKSISAFCFHGVASTYLHLVTHTAGLPETIAGGGDLDSFSRQDVDSALAGLKLTRAPGTAYTYSNLGFGYLADLLSDLEGESFNQLVRDQITSALGMRNTEVVLSATQLSSMVSGYSAGLITPPGFEPERIYDFTDQSGLSGSAAVHSTVNDLLIYLSAEMGITQSPLSGAMALSQIQRFSHKPDPGALAVALGWEILVDSGIIFHSGDLPGYDSFIGWNPTTGVGVVLLSNTSMYTPRGQSFIYYDQATDLGVQILLSGG